MKKHFSVFVLTAAIVLSSTAPVFAWNKPVAAGVSAEHAASAENAAVEKKTAAQVLEEFDGYLDDLYGRTFSGYLWDFNDGDPEHAEYGFYDRTDVPTTNMGSCIFDFDQDGQEELLTVNIKNDYRLQFSMYEVTEDNKVYMSDAYTLLSHLEEPALEQYALEQGWGVTDICVYDYEGPRLLALCSGTGMVATGHISHLIPVKYNGSRFVQDIDPIGYNKFAGINDEMIETYRPKFESLGTGNLTDDACKEIFSNLSSIKNYLDGTKEIVKVQTSGEQDYYSLYEEWRAGDQKERFKATTIYFFSREELEGVND